MVVVKEILHGGMCAGDDRLLLPTLVAYGDGAVLAIDRLESSSCFGLPVPLIKAGWIEPGLLRERLTAYFRSADSRSDMQLPNVFDGTSTALVYTDPAGSVHSVSGRWLFDGQEFETGLRPEIRRARATLRSLITGLTIQAHPTKRWPPTTIQVIVSNGKNYPAAPVVRWPLTAEKTLALVLTGSPGACSVLDGPRAAAVIKAQGRRSTASNWLVNGQSRRLAIGLLIPAMPSCAGRHP